MNGFREGVFAALTSETRNSKNGLCGHFNSKINRKIDILKYADQPFSESLVVSALMEEFGSLKVRVLVDNLVDWKSKLSGAAFSFRQTLILVTVP